MSVEFCKICGFHHPGEECRDFLEAGWTNGDAEEEWDRLQDEEENGESEPMPTPQEHARVFEERDKLQVELDHITNLLKEAVAILDDFQGYYCAEDSCPTVDEAYHNAAAFVAKIKGVNLEV